MSSRLERFQVFSLHGSKNVDLSIPDNTMILVGENGSGKTTLLRLLFHFLSGRWHSLLQFNFKHVAATIDGTEYTISHEQLLNNYRTVDRRFLLELPSSLRHRIIDLIDHGEIERAMHELRRSGLRHAVSENLFRHLELVDETSKEGHKKEIQELIQQIRKALAAQILYLPTFRRIERELSSIFEGADLDELRRSKGRYIPPEAEDGYVELVEFGMKDVQDALSRSLEGIKEFARANLNSLTLNYLGDVVNRNYQKVGATSIADIPEETVQLVLGRIHNNILTEAHKEHVRTVIRTAREAETLSEHDQIISHYFLKLLEFQQALQMHESQVAAFCDLCSQYILDKKFTYNNETFTVSILPTNGQQATDKSLELRDLSSGEKQVVSLFSHLYLSRKQRFFVIIDEPELSLSVPWQRRFLADIKAGDFCTGLIAATHSPFIYDNDLRNYTHALGEFVTN